MSRFSYRPWLLALTAGLVGCGSLIPSAPIEYVETTEERLRAVPEELLQPPIIPERVEEPVRIEDALEQGSALRTYACGLHFRYTLAIEYFTDGEYTVDQPTERQCPEGLDTGFSIPFLR